MNVNTEINVANINKKSGEEFGEKLKLELEKYYCVYYDTGWYIRRKLHIEKNTCQIKFLYSNLDEFRWPKKDDIKKVNIKFILCEPITLNGVNFFTISKQERSRIQKKLKKFKNT
ncbi:hypothetical protein PUN28_020764 [Cardiocondyla obscurior]|uniref:Uncharacterized protein n=1 Tax=Cardiocondyla obscurior TaxID=286306 RepID=A0AAW2E955_9HYME